MGVADMQTSQNTDTLRYERQNRMNPPEFAPGQGDGDLDMSIFSDEVLPSQNSTSIFTQGAQPTGDPMAGAGMQNNMMGFNTQNSFNPMMNPMNQQQQTTKSEEEAFYDALKTGAKASFSFSKQFVSSFSDVTPLYWQRFGFRTMIAGVSVAVLGLVTKLFGFKAGIDITVGSLLSAGLGSVVFFMFTEKARTFQDEYKTPIQEPEQPTQTMDTLQNTFGSSDFGDLSAGDDDDDDFFSDDFEGDDFGDEDFSFGGEDGFEDTSSTDSGEDDWDSVSPVLSEPEVKEVDPETALNSMTIVDKGMYTRQYLWDAFTQVLPCMKNNFAEMKEYNEDSKEFLTWESALREASTASGLKEEDLPYLEKLQENLFTIVVTCNRTKGFKPEVVANELANIYAYSDGKFNDGVSASYAVVGMRCIITIFTGTSAMVSLKDMMLVEKDWVLDSSNYIPVILGIDQLGNVIKADLKNLESLLITGMPRSGKTWFAQAILAQMCAFLSPKELNIYVGDPKNTTSDFYKMKLPHVKKFCGNTKSIIAMLRYVTQVEGERRKKMIGDAGMVNIWDYKAKYPDVEIPIIYVMLDEIVTIASELAPDKEQAQEFRMLLRVLISQLPAYGIRALLIPHVINNDIIEKKTTDLIPIRVSVKGEADHIERVTGAKPKEFPYKLANKGDMAARVTSLSQKVFFMHAPVLKSSNPEIDELFNYLRRLWTKLEPDTVKGSVCEGIEAEYQNQQAVSNFDLGDVDDLDIFSEPDNKNISTVN